MSINLLVFFSIINLFLINPNIEDRIEIVSKAMTIHHQREEIDSKGMLYYIDPDEYIPLEDTMPRLGKIRGNDVYIAIQRLVYEIKFEIVENNFEYETINSFPVRCGKLGFGFRKKSGRTPTGLYIISYPFIAYDKYYPISIEHPDEITTARATIENIISNGQSIYEETQGINDPISRGILIHGWGRSKRIERDGNIGSDGCIHITAEGVLTVTSNVNKDISVYIFIGGSNEDFLDLPKYEKEIFDLID